MSGLANQAAVLALSRIASYGLLLLSPIILVRLLSVEDFGRYREFLVYASLLQAFAAFSVVDSLLYFVPAHVKSTWRVVRYTVVLTGIASTVAIAVLFAGDVIAGGTLVGDYLLPLALYTVLFVNLDFWERLWLANGRTGAVFVYSIVRLGARMLTVIVVAALTRNVFAIIWSLIALEVLRFAGSAVAWRMLDRSESEPPVPGLMRAMLRFCVPTGFGMLLQAASGNLARIAVVKWLGPAALARFTIGTYLEPIIVSLRGSVSQVVLPEMVRRDQQDRGRTLALWHRANVVNAILLFPVVVFFARFAEPLVVTVFGADYRSAAVVLQIAMLVVVRECFDFAPPLRAVNRTLPIMHGSLLALIVCAAGLFVLLPRYGLAGAAWAVVLAKLADALYLGWQVRRAHGLRFAQLIDWSAVGRTALAALVAAIVIADDFWIERFGASGLLLAMTAFGTAYVLALAALRVPELGVLLAGVRDIARSLRFSARG